MKRVFLFCAVILSVSAFGTMAFGGDKSDSLKPLLLDMEGWEAGAAEGSAVDMGSLKLISATKSYTKGDAVLNVTFLVGSNAMVKGQAQVPTVETETYAVKRSEIDGFSVIQTFDKKDKTGAVIVTLEKGQTQGALLLVGFEGMTLDEAFKMAKSYDWKKMKEGAAKLIK